MRHEYALSTKLQFVTIQQMEIARMVQIYFVQMVVCVVVDHAQIKLVEKQWVLQRMEEEEMAVAIR